MMDDDTIAAAMTIDDMTDYDVEIGEPYLKKDALGKYVILQDETMTRNGEIGSNQILLYSSEILVDDNPSEAEIFKMKLKGAYRKEWPF